jgi:hypothetical protein
LLAGTGNLWVNRLNSPLPDKLLQRACQFFSACELSKNRFIYHRFIKPIALKNARILPPKSSSVLHIATPQKPSRYNAATLSLRHEVTNAGKFSRVCR